MDTGGIDFFDVIDLDFPYKSVVFESSLLDLGCHSVDSLQVFILELIKVLEDLFKVGDVGSFYGAISNLLELQLLRQRLQLLLDFFVNKYVEFC